MKESNQSCNKTLRELKLDEVNDFCTDALRCNKTLRELKQNLRRIKVNYKSGCNKTLRELKPKVSVWPLRSPGAGVAIRL